MTRTVTPWFTIEPVQMNGQATRFDWTYEDGLVNVAGSAWSFRRALRTMRKTVRKVQHTMKEIGADVTPQEIPVWVQKPRADEVTTSGALTNPEQNQA